VTVLVDDLTRGPADTTVTFGIVHIEYEIDLSESNAGELREAFARYVQASRKVSAGGGRRGGQPVKPAFSGCDPAAVRARAKARGIEVSPRGRIKAEVVERYRAAGNRPQAGSARTGPEPAAAPRPFRGGPADDALEPY
jgi:Lsr2